MNIETTRTCPFCAETIKAASKLCPRCRQWLTVRSLRNPVVSLWLNGGLIIASLVVLGTVFLSTLERLTNPKPSYTEALDPIKILESSLTWRQTSSDLRVLLTGIITNQSRVPWANVELECRFFDTNGAMIDVAHPTVHFTIQPHDDAGFSASVRPACATNRYASYKLTVTTARNDRSRF